MLSHASSIFLHLPPLPWEVFQASHKENHCYSLDEAGRNRRSSMLQLTQLTVSFFNFKFTWGIRNLYLFHFIPQVNCDALAFSQFSIDQCFWSETVIPDSIFIENLVPSCHRAWHRKWCITSSSCLLPPCPRALPLSILSTPDTHRYPSSPRDRPKMVKWQRK